MPKRIVNSSVMIVRDGKPVYPTVGKAFDFTDPELASINRVNPKALGKIILADPVMAEPAPLKAAPVSAKVSPVEATKV